MSQGPSGAAAGTARASGLPPPAVVRYAGFWIRLLAAVIDVLLVLVLVVAVATILAQAVLLVVGAADSGEISPVLQALPLLVWGWVLFYFIYFPSSAWQATPGKRICGLRIICTDGSRVTGGLALLRLVSYVLSIALLLIGFLMIGWTREKTGLHDMICYTRVVRGKR